ncbi:phospholipid carrier-dependent glycosyltransferase [Lichenibacterium minor]|uniref:Phospholipid carrier-dependent glycosyltransferase n=1 Tax=Lichenibacterium minor TaxID=2316528 RepID=A0A4Q2U4R8_9HYPH|nr:glycosyltransferase family 39 protein [Lichenibacterium minor]RYC31559.1 phospholipid carrier-dependent glycosyltransferase [Lichenibacterium minor]
MSQFTGPAAARRRFVPVLCLLLLGLAFWLPGFASLPPMDRDEPRFAQASKQMVETGDFVAIRFGDEARNKKPVGIHWLQAAALRGAEAAGVPDAAHAIWVYRLPSLLGALAAVLLTFWAALPILDDRGALLAGALVAATPLLGVEARLATTDAVLTATVAAAMGALGRLYLAEPATRKRMWGAALVFWVSVGVGILIKGPITPLIPALAALALSVKDRSGRWLAAVRPVPGVALVLLIALPWFVLILLKTRGAFIADAVGHDLLGKVGGVQESHGAPPGFYFAAFWATAWPLAPFAIVTAAAAWRRRREPSVAFLLSWAIPFWIVLEAVPTKLVHYALPLYPAFAILAVLLLLRPAVAGAPIGTYRGRACLALMALVPVAIAALAVAGEGRMWTLGPALATGAAAAVAAALGLCWLAYGALRGARRDAAIAFAVAAAVPLYLFVYGWLLTPGVAPGLAVSQRLAAGAASAAGPSCPAPRFATVGDREPSLMFETDGGLLMTDAAGAARFLEDGPCRVAFVAADEERPFAAALGPAPGVALASRVAGVAINGGHKLDIGIYVRH